ncbi:hypothetical protein [Halococcus sp. IIIV-5B]|uniref:glycoside hydrolase family 78 protein n=1 Tax=Halococcus sp. IIIV-5B TaxID=2321230 RepID=UPI0018F4ADA7|nr:hypothetical protein [Halococcus sp. IIIV-5B]
MPARDNVLDLRVEYESEPNNVPVQTPRFSWRVETEDRGVAQGAYRILVARSRDALMDERGDIWDFGRIESPNLTNVTYEGPPLATDTEYHWTARIWDRDDEATSYANPTTFSTAIGDQ